MSFLSLLDNTAQSVSGTDPAASIPMDTAPTNNTGGLSSFFGGLLSKAAETAIDVGGDLVKKNNMPGTIYPSGQTNPAQLQATAAASAANQSAMNKQYLYIGAGVAVLLVVVLIVAKK